MSFISPEDIRIGLAGPGQKELPSKYFYDTVGSRLFDVITALPEYGLTRAEERILRRDATDMVAGLRRPLRVAELGSGSGSKTRRILEALGPEPLDYYPIEISASALEACARELGDIPGVRVRGLGRDYLAGLTEATAQRVRGERMLLLFLGSTIGNFEPAEAAEFLRRIRAILCPGDWLLLGADMVKAVPVMVSAYDDPLGVTAAFNLNMLARINRELGAGFDLGSFEHVALFNPDTRNIEMHLRSRCSQEVAIPGAGLTVSFDAGETIRTERSHKHLPGEVAALATQSGFRCDATWTDEEWPFTDNLLTAV